MCWSWTGNGRSVQKRKRVRLAVELQYDGTAYHGWQIQPNAVTVQEAIERVFSQYFDEPITVVGCGRTDAGVHAQHFVLHFDYHKDVDEKAVYSLNKMLPNDVALLRIRRADEAFHSRFDATFRQYKYIVARNKSPFNRLYQYHYQPQELNVAEMNRATQFLMGEADFASFCKVGSDVKTTICTISEAHWTKEDDNLVFTITADRFLRNMVRAIVGTLLEVGTGLRKAQDMPSIIQERHRSATGRSVPAQGLFLWQIGYEQLERFDVLSH